MATHTDVKNCIERILMRRSWKDASKDDLIGYLDKLMVTWSKNKSVLKDIEALKLTIK